MVTPPGSAVRQPAGQPGEREGAPERLPEPPAEPVADAPVVVFQPNAINVDAGLFAWDLRTGEVVCDPVTYRLHGLPEDTSATMDMFLSRIPSADLPHIAEATKRMMTACGTYQIEYRVVGEDGSLRSMEARGRVLPGEDGRPARMMGLVMDTTVARATRAAEERRLREGTDRARRTHDFTAALTSAVTVDAIMAAAREGLRAYGADSLIVVAERDGRMAVVASCGFDDATVGALADLDTAGQTPVSAAIEWGSPVYLGSPEAFAGDYPHLAGLARDASQRAWAALPVPDSHGHVGVCLFGFPEPHEFLPEERALLSAASGLLAQSLERARIYESEHSLARELQWGMLPRGSLATNGVTIATRYQAATSGMEIGGDFYDAIEFPDGRLALVIGDVQGHNLLAASLMGRLRTAVHAYAREGHGPAEVMARANQWLAGLNTDPDISLFATCCFVVLCPATGALAMCRAGHPQPLVVTPGSTARVLDCEGGLPLGIDPQAQYATVETRVPPASILLLSTDGLMEADGDDVDYNIRCLLDVLHRGVAADLETLADDLLSIPRRPLPRGDDVALLLARIDGAA